MSRRTEMACKANSPLKSAQHDEVPESTLSWGDLIIARDFTLRTKLKDLRRRGFVLCIMLRLIEKWKWKWKWNDEELKLFR